MKKYLKFLILMIICFMPLLVDAKTTFTYEWKNENKYFLGSVDGKYLFTEEEYFEDDTAAEYIVYNKEGSLEENLSFEFSNATGPSDYYDDELLKIYLRHNEAVDFQYNETLKKYYLVDPYSEEVYVYEGTFDDSIETLSFEDTTDVDALKNILGKEYDVLKSIYDADLDIDGYTYEDGYYVAWCYNNDYDYYKVFDSNGSLIYNVEFLYDARTKVHVYDDKIYEFVEHNKINIYDLKGELLETIDFSNDINSLYSDTSYYLGDFYLKDNNLIIQYYVIPEENPVSDMPQGMTSVRVNKYDVIKDNVTVTDDVYMFNLKYKMTNDITLVTSKTGGSFTTERKIDEFDREYVELKITTQEGYIVDTIKVTDSNGNEIEVTDNKFYMPGSDVTIQVTYKGGEYLPIPDTGLGKSITLIIIGALLISLGAYTINYVRQE